MASSIALKTLSHVSYDIRKTLFRGKPNKLPGFGNRRHAPTHVLKTAILIRLFVRDMDYFAFRLRDLLDFFCQLIDGHFGRISNIHDLTKCLWRMK